MGTNAYETLQALNRTLASIPFDMSELGNYSLLSEYRVTLRTSCEKALADYSGPVLSGPNQRIGVPLLEFFADCALATAVAATLQRALSENLQGRTRGQTTPQEQTHLLVDLWGQVEACKALFDYAARQVINSGAASGERSVTAMSLCAQCRVLSQGIEQLLLTLAVKLGEYHNLASVAELVDGTILQLRDPKYDSLKHAIDNELYGLVA